MPSLPWMGCVRVFWWVTREQVPEHAALAVVVQGLLDGSTLKVSFVLVDRRRRGASRSRSHSGSPEPIRTGRHRASERHVDERLAIPLRRDEQRSSGEVFRGGSTYHGRERGGVADEGRDRSRHASDGASRRSPPPLHTRGWRPANAGEERGPPSHAAGPRRGERSRSRSASRERPAGTLRSTAGRSAS